MLKVAQSALIIAATIAFSSLAFAGQKGNSGASHTTPTTTHQTSPTPIADKSNKGKTTGKTYLQYKFGTVFTTKK
jgi:hypothetical protein